MTKIRRFTARLPLRAPDRVDRPSPAPLTGRERERALVDAWREAHWSLRLRLEEIARRFEAPDIEALYDEARRRDNQLSEFYQLRAEALARQVREPGSEGSAESAPPLTVPERALLARFRALDPEERAEVLRLAGRLASR